MFDVAVIGGGPAGLAAALALVRARKRVALYDCWPPRNASASEVRGYVTQDGTPPAEMRQVARDQLARYDTFELHDDQRVDAVRGQRDRFIVDAAGARLETRRVLLACGLVDVLPDLPGYRALWGQALFQCPYCHAWEVRDRAFGYLAPDASAMDWAVLLRAWTRDLIVFTSATFEPPRPIVAELECARIRLETRRVIALRHDGGRLLSVEVAGGEQIARDVLFVRPPQAQTALVQRLVRELGLRLDRRDLVHTDAHGETSVPGMYAAGDLMIHEHGALTAAAQGSHVAHALDEALTRELVLTGAL